VRSELEGPEIDRVPEIGDDGADGGGDAGEGATDTIGIDDEVPCTCRFPTDGAN
jgi:hypothetical protein